MGETDAVNAFLAARDTLAKCGFAVMADAGRFFVIPQGGSIADTVHVTANVATLVMVATGIKIGWEWHVAKVAAEPPTSGVPEQS